MKTLVELKFIMAEVYNNIKYMSQYGAFSL